MSSKLSLLQKKISQLSNSPAWSGQISFQSSENGENGKATIVVRNRFVRDWLRENFLLSVQKEMQAIPGEELSIEVVVGVPLPPSSPPSEEILPRPILRTPLSSPPSTPSHPEASPPRHETLKEKYSFQNFVVGPANQFAHAASYAVAKLPGKNYNPLFVYGGVGLGKTHLLNAIGLAIFRDNPRLRIIYIPAEKFMNELIYCMRFDKMGPFRKKYREECDVLLIDDIQFIAGKERTQEEFFHTFNHLYESQRQLVLTSDQPPRQIPDLEERLRSRFEWGLLADIQAPDLETRAAILRKKAEIDGIRIDNEVALFLASHITSNVRELEGSLIRLNAFASLHSAPITVDLAKEVLKTFLPSFDRILTVEEVQKIVADFYKIRLNDLVGKCRIKSLALPRQIAMYLCRKHIKTSYPEIGHKFGGKDHSTVVHAFGKIQRILGSDPLLQEQIGRLEKSLTR